jgi:hypothetical protein
VKDGMSKSTQAVGKLQPMGGALGCLLVRLGACLDSPKEAFGLECPAQHVLKDCTLSIA